MIENKIGELLQKSDVTISDFARGIGLNYSSAWALASENVSGIKFETLDKVCAFFKCQPGDVLHYNPNYIPGVSQTKQEIGA